MEEHALVRFRQPESPAGSAALQPSRSRSVITARWAAPSASIAVSSRARSSRWSKPAFREGPRGGGHGPMPRPLAGGWPRGTAADRPPDRTSLELRVRATDPAAIDRRARMVGRRPRSASCRRGFRVSVARPDLPYACDRGNRGGPRPRADPLWAGRVARGRHIRATRPSGVVSGLSRRFPRWPATRESRGIGPCPRPWAPSPGSGLAQRELARGCFTAIEALGAAQRP